MLLPLHRSRLMPQTGSPAIRHSEQSHRSAFAPLITHQQHKSTLGCVHAGICVLLPSKPVALPLTWCFNWQHKYSKCIFKTLAQNSSYWSIPAVGGSNPVFNFSHFALLHLWLEWIMIISWLWFGPCLWAWGHSLSELTRRWQWGAFATYWVCSVKHFLPNSTNTSCTLRCKIVLNLPCSWWSTWCQCGR